jgi:hypothetical protein
LILKGEVKDNSIVRVTVAAGTMEFSTETRAAEAEAGR